MKIIKISVLLSCLLSVLCLEALFLMPSTYWLAGRMTIQSADPRVTYKIYAYDDASKALMPLGVQLPVNRQFAIIELLGGGFQKCPSFSEQANETICFLVPSVPFMKGQGSQTDKEFLAETKAGTYHPYVVLYRKGVMLNIYILGPTIVGADYAQKISINLNALELNWVEPSRWYKKLDRHAFGMAFALTFNADTGCFPTIPSNREILSNDALYLCGLDASYAVITRPLGSNWIGQNLPLGLGEVYGMTLQGLQDQGIVTFQCDGLDLEDLQWVINSVNTYAGAQYASVI